MSDTIYLRVGTADKITLTDLIDSLSDFRSVLQELDATIAEYKHGNMVWEVVSMEQALEAMLKTKPPEPSPSKKPKSATKSQKPLPQKKVA